MKRLTQEEFKLRVNSILGDDYEVLGTYINSHTKIEYLHKTCGNIYMQAPMCTLNRGYGCPRCGAIKSVLSRKANKSPKPKKERVVRDTFLEKVNNTQARFNNEYEFLYMIDNNYCAMLYVDCCTVYKCHYKNMRKNTALNQRCKKCFPKDIQMTSKKFNTIIGKEYTLLSDYINAKTKVHLKHNICGSDFYVNPDNFKRGLSRCLCQSGSSGELAFQDYLIKHNIEFTREVTFDGLLSSRGYPLRYDFRINFKGEDVLVEIDGGQHYKHVPFMLSKEEFNKSKERDKLKDDFSNIIGIKLVRLSYKDLANLVKNDVNAGGNSLDVYIR